jgi:hypothetical protein
MKSHTEPRASALPTAPTMSPSDVVARAGRPVRDRLRRLALPPVMALVAIAGGAGSARADTVRCPGFQLRSVQWVGGRYQHFATRVQRVSADGVSCAEVHGLFRRAYAAYTGGGGDSGVQWGSPAAHPAGQPHGWSVRALAEYSRVPRPSTLDWIVGWEEQLRSRGTWIRFTQGQITRYSLKPRYWRAAQPRRCTARA